MRTRTGIARITSTPPAPGYHADQFLGAAPPTVPPVLDSSLFHPASGTDTTPGAQVAARPGVAR